jgi:hypothetical protein
MVMLEFEGKSGEKMGGVQVLRGELLDILFKGFHGEAQRDGVTQSFSPRNSIPPSFSVEPFYL